MSTIKDEVIRLVKGMPDNATMEEIIDALDYKKLVDRRLTETREALMADEVDNPPDPTDATDPAGAGKAPRSKGKRR
ncbi:MAG: hypothetical protein NTX50_15310 [Candidatus Sumerlaeota bacterium]|nr:hypothetical protein [Candidatus Sumerlaeota bacterium]